MPTVLWTCGTLKRVKFSRGATVVPLLSLKMVVLRRFWGVFGYKTSCRCKRLSKAMHFSRWYIMPTVLWTCSTLKHVTFSRQREGLQLLRLKMGVLRPFSGVFWWKTACRCMSLLKDMHFYKRYIMPTVLWNYSTFKHVTFSRQRAGVPLLSLKMGVLRPFSGVFWWKTACRCMSLLKDMHFYKRYIMPTVLWTYSTFKHLTFSRQRAGVPLLSLKIGVLRRFWGVFCEKPHVDIKKRTRFVLMSV